MNKYRIYLFFLCLSLAIPGCPDDDLGNPGVGATTAFNIATNIIEEKNTNTNVSISLSAPAANGVVVAFSVSGSATSNVDFKINTPSPIKFSIGQSTANINISLFDDLNAENNETVVLKIEEVTGSVVRGATTHTLTIVDNDSAEIFVADSGRDAVLVFNQNDNGDVAFKREIRGANTKLDDPNYIFVKDGEIFIIDRNTDSVLVFDQNGSGNLSPKREINGANTKFNFPAGIAVSNSEIFVVDFVTDSVLVFNQNDNGNIAPKREINGGNSKIATPLRVFVLDNEIFVADAGPDSILVFNRNDNGDIAPKREIGGANTKIQNPTGVFVANNELFVIDTNLQSILVFNQNDNGNIAPKREINGVNTRLSGGNFGVFVANNEIYATTTATDSILVFSQNDNGNIAPKREINGLNTGLQFPFAVALNIEILDTMTTTNMFSLTVSPGIRGIELRWQNAITEVESFAIWRQTNNGPFVKINKLEILSSKGLHKEPYVFIDAQANPQQNSYTYKLEYKHERSKNFDIPVTLKE